MKKQLVLGLGLAVLATPAAFASKARLQALGEDTNGSFFISDNRNIFLNAAEVNNNKDLVTFEWGTGSTEDTDVAPNAEGGVLKSVNNMVYGLHLGRVTSFNETAALYNGSNAGLTDVYQPSNTIDLFVGGDAGIKWGVDLTYASSEDDAFAAAGAGNTVKAEGQTLDLNVGIQAGDLAAYVKGGIMGNTEHKNPAGTAVAAEVDRKHEYEIGASYKITDYTVFAQYNNSKYDNKVAGASIDVKGSSYLLGVARMEKLNDKTMAFVKLSGVMSNIEGFGGAGGVVDGNEVKTTAIPVSIGLEHDAASWLTLRGSVAQNLWSKVDADDTDKRTVANSTNVNAGASLKFGELTIDGVVGTNNGNGAIADSNSERGTLALDNLMTRASVTYRF